MPYTCKRCGYTANHISHIRTHLQKKNRCKPVYGNEAPEAILAELETAEGRRKHTSEMVELVIDPSATEVPQHGVYGCKRCGYTTNHINHLRTHLQKKNRCEPVHSDEAPEAILAELETAEGRKRHRRKANSKVGHDEPAPSAIEVDPIEFRDAVIRDLRTELASYRSLNAKLTSQVKRLTNICEKRFVCGECDKPFGSDAELTIHKRVHTGEKPYQCDQCPMAFASPTGLNYHTVAYHTRGGQMRRKKQEERICQVLLGRGLERYEGGDAHPPVGSFKREHQVDFRCVGGVDTSYARIDFVIGVEGGLVFLEVDEHQHKFGYDPSCDAKRMAKVHESLAVEGRHIPVRWIRYNPHEYTVDGKTTRTGTARREARLLACVDRARLVGAPPMSIEYLYYDTTGGRPDVTLADAYPFRDAVRVGESSG